MKIYRELDQITKPFPNACVTIGNFDGVHLGHQRLFDAVRQKAAQDRGTSIAITFNPHPLQVLRPGGIKLISTCEQKIELIAMSGIDVLIIIPFDKEFSATTALQFVDEILIGRIGVKQLSVGYDYAFGKGRAGDIDFLRRQGNEKGFSVTVIDPYYQGDILVSSTRIREFVAAGRMDETRALLGRCYQIRGEVQRGKQRGGKEIGFPTANLHIDEEDLIPRHGVYVCQVICDGKRYGGVINIGLNPTFSENKLIAEVHIFDFNQDIYGKPIKVNLLHFMRAEQKFAGIPELSAQIAHDVIEAKGILEGAGKQINGQEKIS
jgi:riboflavin kinase/FMN adenylyltransferase